MAKTAARSASAQAWQPAARKVTASVAIVLMVIFSLELFRRIGVPVPVPFLILYASVALAAIVSGLRGGLLAALLASAFVVYSAWVGYGPPSLTGGLLPVAAGIVIAFLAGGLLGINVDTNQKLITELEQRGMMLDEAHRKLASKFVERDQEFVGITSEVSRLRNQISSAARHSPAGIIVFGNDMTIDSFNASAHDMIRRATLQENPPDQIKEFFAIADVQLNGRRLTGEGEGPLIAALTEGKVSDDLNLEVRCVDGTTMWLQGSIAPIRAGDGSITGATGVFIDVTEREVAKQDLQRLYKRLMTVQEEERSYLARELHDEIGQHLTGIKMYLHTAVRQPHRTEIIQECIKRVENLMHVVRNLAVELRPAVLDDLGLAAALRWHLGRQILPEGCKLSFTFSAALDDLSSKAATVLFRIVQEGVNNAIKHSRASNITVQLYTDQKNLLIEIEDDGDGFDFDLHKQKLQSKSGFGLRFMQERIREFDGELNIEATPGRGTRLLVRMPEQVVG